MFTKSKFTTTYILGGILIILTCVVFLVKGNLAFLGPETSNQFLTDFNVEEITKIELISSSQTQTLDKKDNQWVVDTKENVRADQEALVKILEKSKALKRDEIASKNPEKQSVFQVDQSGTQVKLFTGEKEIANFYVGKSGPDFSSTYIRKEGEDTVYLFKENLRNIFNRSDLRDLKILTFDKSKVKSLTFEAPGTTLVVEKIEDKWKLTSPLNVEVTQEKVNRTLDDLSLLKGIDIATDKSEAELGFDEPTLKITISLTENGDQTLLIGAKTGSEDDSDYYAKNEDSDTIFTLSKITVEDFPKKLEDLLVEK